MPVQSLCGQGLEQPGVRRIDLALGLDRLRQSFRGLGVPAGAIQRRAVAVQRVGVALLLHRPCGVPEHVGGRLGVGGDRQDGAYQGVVARGKPSRVEATDEFGDGRAKVMAGGSLGQQQVDPGRGACVGLAGSSLELGGRLRPVTASIANSPRWAARGSRAREARAG